MPPWILRDRPYEWGQKTYLMGVLNVTPDSFSDGGRFDTVATAVAQAQKMVADGADWLDIGGESTRPNAAPVALADELARVIPVVTALRQNPQFDTVPLSIDTTKAAVARLAVEVGADLINDISGARRDHQMLQTVAALGVPIILMHSRGTPQTMQRLTEYQDVVVEVRDGLADRVAAAIAAGIDPTCIGIDPGIGFAKTMSQNLELLRNLGALKSLNCPTLVGVSRKSFIGHLLSQPDPSQRVWGTAAAAALAIGQGADLLRVHDVGPMYDVTRVADGICRPSVKSP
jgi:dihydropteroate synthase